MRTLGFDSIGLNRALIDTGFPKADRDYIVNAVNIHEELLATLQQTLDALCNESFGHESEWVKIVKNDAKQALLKAKAEGSTNDVSRGK